MSDCLFFFFSMCVSFVNPCYSTCSKLKASSFRSVDLPLKVAVGATNPWWNLNVMVLSLRFSLLFQCFNMLWLVDVRPLRADTWWEAEVVFDFVLWYYLKKKVLHKVWTVRCNGRFCLYSFNWEGKIRRGMCFSVLMS